MLTPGQRLRLLREQLGLTIRDVETASARIAAKYGRDDYTIPLSRLSEIETKGILPSIYRLHSLAVIYRRDLRELLAWYGVEVDDAAADLGFVAPPRSHRLETLESTASVLMPVRLDPGFDPRQTCNLGRMVEQWGLVPLTFLSQFASSSYTYGYVGTEDFTMYPLIVPGAFLQIDESRTEVSKAMWRSEYERPIYFVETREGYTCCWCTVKGDQITLQPHPLSPVPVRILKHPQDAEVIGQVVGVAMRLGDWRAGGDGPASKALPTQN